MDDRAWTTGDGPKASFDGAVVWLREHRVLLPGVSTLARLVARVRDAAMARLWDTLAAPLTAAQASALEQLTTTVTPVTDTTLVGRELTELRELEAASRTRTRVAGVPLTTSRSVVARRLARWYSAITSARLQSRRRSTGCATDWSS